MKKVLLVLLVIAIAMTSVLASCGPSPSDNDNSGEPTATPTPTRTENTIAVWWSSTGADKQLIDEAWFDFKRKYANEEGSKYNAVKDELVLFTTDGDANSTTALEVQILASMAPDLIRMDHVYVAALGQGGNVLDLNKEFNATEEIGSKFIESTWKASTWEKTGAVYGIPFDANTAIFGAAKETLDQASVQLPTTFDELLTVGNTLKQRSETSVYTLPCGAANENRLNWPTFVFLFYVWRLGGDVLSGDQTQAIFNKPETGVEALNMMLRLREEGIISANYEEGTSTICDYGTWRLNTFTEPMVFDLLPELKEGVPRYSGLGLYDLSVVSTSMNPELAYDFAEHFATGKSELTDEYYQFTYANAKEHIVVPSLIEAANYDAFADENTQAFWDTAVRQMDLVKWRPCVPQWPSIEEEISKAINSVMRDGVDPKEALDTAARAVDAKLQQ